MDEQIHRRRRRGEGPAGHEEAAIAQEAAAVHEDSAVQAHEEDVTAAGAGEPAHAAVHHRRRRTEGQTQEEHAHSDPFWHPESELLDAHEAEPEAPQKKSPFRLFKAIDAAVCRTGDSILAALKQAGVGVVFLLGLAAGGLKKAGAAIKRLRSTKRAGAGSSAVHTGKRVFRKKAEESAPTEQDVTLEPTRPEAYQGMGEKRNASRKKRTVRAPGKKVSVAYSAAMAAMICVALVSAYMVTSILWRSISTKRLNSSLSQRYSALEQQSQQDETEVEEVPDVTAEPEMTPLPEFSPRPTLLPPELMVPPPEDEAQTPVTTATPKPAQAVKTTKFHQVGGDALPEMEALYQENRDLIGWLRMEGILDLPVVYRDNEYYLTHDFYKNKSASGTLFLDVSHPFRENAQNLLLHGHNMKDGTMFGRLVQYETNLQFLKNNPFIQFSTLWKKEHYVIFAVLDVSLDVNSEDFFDYFTHPTFTTDAQFDRYVRSLQNRSLFSIPINVQPTDALLTLSTCLDEDRLVIVARRLREGESRSDLRHQVQLAAKQ